MLIISSYRNRRTSLQQSSPIDLPHTPTIYGLILLTVFMMHA